MNNTILSPKILQLSSSFGFFGAENVLAELSRELGSSKYIPVIGIFNNTQNPHLELVDFARKNDIAYEIFNCHGQFDLHTIFSIRNFIKRNNISIVQTHGYKSDFYGFLATLFMKVPLLATCHPWIKTSSKIKLYTRIDKSMLNRFKKVITVSQEVKQEIIQAGVPSEKILIIPNGIDVKRFTQQFDREKLLVKIGIPVNRKVVGTVGRLSLEKGHHFLIEAARNVIKEYPSLHFLVAGDGSSKNELLNEVKELEMIDHFTFPGIVEDIPGPLSVLDIFVLPSLTEGLPMALLEAMAAKKPVIASKVGSIPEVIIHNESGLLVPPADAAGLERSLLELLNDQPRAFQLAEKGYQTIVNGYTSEIMAKRYLEVYETLLN